jgi:hypothetical protein
MIPALTALLLAAQVPNDAPELTSLAVLRAGDDACALLNDAQRALLDAAIARASDDAVLAGADPQALDATLARETLAPACTEARLPTLVREHLERIESLASFTEISFQGTARTWIVDRRPARRNAPPRWRIVQNTGAADAAFGVAEVDQAFQLALAFNSDERLSSAVLIARDPERLPYPMDFTAGGLLPPPGRDGASAWGAPAGQDRRFVAQDRLSPDAAAALAPASGDPARGFVFSEDALVWLAQLTPREGVAIELRDRAGDVASLYWFEVGSLQGAMAMQAIPLIEIEDGEAAP